MMMCSFGRPWGDAMIYCEVGRREVRTNDCLFNGGGERKGASLDMR
jgi:hypothetical protein